jgi:hypothetical protein
VLITGKQVRNSSLTGADIKDRSLTAKDIKAGQLPAGQQGPQGLRGETGPAGAKGDAGSPGQNGTNATVNGVAAGGALTGTYPNPGLAAAEAWREVGTSGNPGFTPGCTDGGPTLCWGNRVSPPHNTAAFYRDPYGVVHLKGDVVSKENGPSAAAVFTLPAGYRTGTINYFVVPTDGGPGVITVEADGGVSAGIVAKDDYIVLDGITFRCGPSGSAGCP